MKLSRVQEILEAEVLCENDLLSKNVRGSFACGLTGEMFLYVKPETLDITFLTNIHVNHAAQVMDAIGVSLFGDKKPYKSVIMNNEINNNPILATTHPTFKCCGRTLLNNFKDNKKAMDSMYVG